MPKILSDADVADFRERLCGAAERLFAERGPGAVTMRQLAADLNVSPMTPYRYFKDKDDILAAVRTSGFNRFSEAIEHAYAKATSARAKATLVGEAYFNFAFENPQAYKLMFDLSQPNEDEYPELKQAAARARATMTDYVEGLVAAEVVAGDANDIGLMFWSSLHGAIQLEMAGKLASGGARALVRRLGQVIARGLRPDAA